jgi:hypothetical protein
VAHQGWLAGDPLPDPLLRLGFVGVFLVLAHKPTHRPIAQHHDVVQHFASCGLHESFRNGVHVGRSHRRLDYPRPYLLLYSGKGTGAEARAVTFA